MNRLIASIFAIVAALATGVLAQEGPHIIEAAPRIMVFPFTAIGNPGSYDWVGTGIEQSLLVEVNRPGSISMSVSDGTPPTTQPSANPVADAARHGATIAVFGSYQILNDEIRVTGQATDTGNGQVLAGLSATGPIHDLFKVEDTLNAQLQRALPVPQPQQSIMMNDAMQEPQATAPAPVVVENEVPAVQPDYAYGDTYGVPYPYYSDFGYGGIYGGFVSFGGNRFFHHDFHGNHNFFPDQNPIGFGNGFRGGFGSFNGFTPVPASGMHGGGFPGGFHGGGFHGGGFGGVRK